MKPDEQKTTPAMDRLAAKQKELKSMAKIVKQFEALSAANKTELLDILKAAHSG